MKNVRLLKPSLVVFSVDRIATVAEIHIFRYVI